MIPVQDFEFLVIFQKSCYLTLFGLGYFALSEGWGGVDSTPPGENHFSHMVEPSYYKCRY